MQNPESSIAPACVNANQSVQKQKRQRQFLQFLLRHGPLSTSTIQELIEPKITYQQACEVMRRLRANRFVEPRIKNFPNEAVIYQISQREHGRKIVGEYLGCSPELLHQPYHTYTVGYKNCAVAFWQVVLESLMKDATLFRKHEIRTNETLNSLFDTDEEYDKYLPHLLLTESRADSPPSCAGLYLPDWSTSEANFREIVKKHIKRTRIDGLLFVAEEQDFELIFEKISNPHFLSQIKMPLEQFENFFACSDLRSIRKKEMPEVIKLGLKKRPFDKWFHSLPSRSNS